ncbi:MAG TPA: YgaP-like transmembrane domain [Bacteroidales bacterium]|nr:YgaP-like transmembrane domain [Bacteroidales bacterium]
MEINVENVGNRVRENTSDKKNEKIDQKILDHIRQYKGSSREEIDARIEKLRKEWDIEKALEVNASAVIMAGLLMGTLGRKRWYLLSGVVSVFLLQHGIQGWCPPASLLRSLGVRTRREIDEEIYALKELRGDFNHVSADSSAVEILASFRK